MEHALRLHIANQRSFSAVYDVLMEKSMRRFHLVADWHFQRLERDMKIRAWAEKEVAGYNVSHFDIEHSAAWMTVWSTAFVSGSAEELWGETEKFARDYNRDTVLFSVDDDDGACYRFYSPGRDERAWVAVGRGGASISAEHPERFFQELLKRYRCGSPELEGLSFASREAACGFLDGSFHFRPGEMPSEKEMLHAAEHGVLPDPFRVVPFVYSEEYLAYDPKTAYAQMMDAVWGLLEPLGFRKKDMNFYRLWNGETYMECLNFQKQRFLFDQTHDTGFTINVSYGSAAEQGKSCWRAEDFCGMNMAWGERIGPLTWGYDHWYELYPGANTQEVTQQVLSDIEKTLEYLEEKRLHKADR